jgi:four helix bundle protein
MQQTTAVPAPAVPAVPAAVLDVERLEVFHVAVEFQAAAAARLIPSGHAVLRDQLERASLSVVLNISEGAARRGRRDRARFFTIARGSASESAALIHLLAVRGIAPADECQKARALAVRVVQMLTKMAQRLAP